jgi:nucleoid-associated protein YgaU
MSRGVVLLLAAGGTVMAGALAFAWHGQILDRAMIDQVTRPAQDLPAALAPAPVANAASGPAVPSSRAPISASRSGTVMAPSFDIARIEPNGRAVIAGRATPGARIVLLDGGREIIRASADGRGEWVLLVQDPPLAHGQHELRVVQHVEGRAPVTSEQVVVAVVPAPASADKPEAAPAEETLVMVVPPDGAATLVQPPSSGGVPRSGDLAMSTLDYDDRGQVTITGQAMAGASVRAYLDGAAVAEGRAGRDGRWQLIPDKPINPGTHTLRLDRLAETGRPTARLEIKFDRAPLAAPAAGEGRRLHVVRGDTLWNISRAHYGEGGRFTVIFAANREQIRDPNLIYPGQIFSLPKTN